MIDEEAVVDHGGWALEEHVLDHMSDGEDEGDGEGHPLGDVDELVHPNVQQDVVQLDVEDPESLPLSKNLYSMASIVFITIWVNIKHI